MARQTLQLVAVLMTMCQVAVRANMFGSIVDRSSSGGFGVTLWELGHDCYDDSIGSLGNWVFTTGTGYDCLVNPNQIGLAASAAASINCTITLDGVFQTDPTTQEDIWVGVSGVVDAPGGTPCVSVAVAAVGNASPVTASTTCAACKGDFGSVPLSYTQLMNVGTENVDIDLFAPSGDACWSQSVGGLSTTTFTTGPGYGCTTVSNKYSLSAPFVNACNISTSAVAAHALTALVGVEHGSVCVSPALQPATLSVVLEGKCPPCEGM